jgi:hypothetical protein
MQRANSGDISGAVTNRRFRRVCGCPRCNTEPRRVERKFHVAREADPTTRRVDFTRNQCRQLIA